MQSEYAYFDKYMYCYTHTDIGKALRIYKEHWKEMLEEKCPDISFEYDAITSVFFKELAKSRTGSTIKLNLDKTFPLYLENGIYKISELQAFYYNRAKNTAHKFDERNRSDYYQRKLDSYE